LPSLADFQKNHAASDMISVVLETALIVGA
jgi:hypothetical protein